MLRFCISVYIETIMSEQQTKSPRTNPLTALSPSEQGLLLAALRAEGLPAGAWIGRRYKAAPATVLGAAAGLPVRPSTAALLRQVMKEGKGAT